MGSPVCSVSDQHHIFCLVCQAANHRFPATHGQTPPPTATAISIHTPTTSLWPPTSPLTPREPSSVTQTTTLPPTAAWKTQVLTAIQCDTVLSDKMGSQTKKEEFWTGNEVPAGLENSRPGVIQGVVVLRQMRCCLPATTVKARL